MSNRTSKLMSALIGLVLTGAAMFYLWDGERVTALAYLILAFVIYIADDTRALRRMVEGKE